MPHVLVLATSKAGNWTVGKNQPPQDCTWWQKILEVADRMAFIFHLYIVTNTSDLWKLHNNNHRYKGAVCNFSDSLWMEVELWIMLLISQPLATQYPCTLLPTLKLLNNGKNKNNLLLLNIIQLSFPIRRHANLSQEGYIQILKSYCIHLWVMFIPLLVSHNPAFIFHNQLDKLES